MEFAPVLDKWAPYTIIELREVFTRARIPSGQVYPRLCE